MCNVSLGARKSTALAGVGFREVLVGLAHQGPVLVPYLGQITWYLHLRVSGLFLHVSILYHTGG
jgi:hypothetical protein